MGDQITIHCQGDLGLDAVLGAVEACLGHCLTRIADVDWPLYGGVSLGIDMSVYAAEFVDDYGIAFSRYKYIVDLDPRAVCLPDPGDRIGFAIAVARVLARSCAKGGASCIVVRSLCELIEDVPARGGRV